MKTYDSYTIPDDDGYVKGIGWRRIRGIKVITSKKADVLTGYYHRQHEEGYQRIRVKCIMTNKSLDDRWHIFKYNNPVIL